MENADPPESLENAQRHWLHINAITGRAEVEELSEAEAAQGLDLSDRLSSKYDLFIYAAPEWPEDLNRKLIRRYGNRSDFQANWMGVAQWSPVAGRYRVNRNAQNQLFPVFVGIPTRRDAIQLKWDLEKTYPKIGVRVESARMKTIHHNRWVKAFTLPEVTLAIGVVALGLVAVFSILPFGLTAQKDNREETIIRYEAQIWREFLLAGGLMMDDLGRVDRVELHEPLDLNGSRDPKKAPKFSHVFYNPYRGVPDNQNAGHTLLGHRLEHGTGTKAWYSYKGTPLVEGAIVLAERCFGVVIDAGGRCSFSKGRKLGEFCTDQGNEWIALRSVLWSGARHHRVSFSQSRICDGLYFTGSA